MTQVLIPTGLLTAGLRTEFWDTYEKARNRVQASWLSKVMDLGATATTRNHTYGYIEAAPHLAYWRRGDTIPTDAMKGVSWDVPTYEFARRVPWYKNDRKDDQTKSLLQIVRMTAASAALNAERFFFDLITETASFLPAIPNAPDGASFFATTAGGADRFGISSGNLITGSGVSTVAQIQTDYYAAIAQFRGFQDGQGQPLFDMELVDAGVLIVHSTADQLIFEKAFEQLRQGVVMGTDAGTTPSNVIKDASRNVELRGSSRIATGDWWIFLKESPTKPTFFITREGLIESSALEGDNNSDHVRTTGEEYMQWECRVGAGVALPYGAAKINNS